MERLFNGLLPAALQCGITVSDFWEMTYGEIVITIKAKNEVEKNRIREAATLNHHLANLIGLSVARLMDKNAKYPSLQEAFPGMFDDIVQEQQAPKQQDWRVAKERLMQYAEAHNRKRGGN